MNKEEYESPYCDICGTCGYIGCCGIRNFISEHIKGKTNCKNEDLIISELIDLCDYKDKVFEKNDKLKQQLKGKDKEIQRLNKECDTYMKIATKRGNIINELEKFLEEKRCYEDLVILNKLKELKEGK